MTSSDIEIEGERRQPCRQPLACRIVLGLLLTTTLVSSFDLSVAVAGPGLVRLDVTIGKSQVLEIKEPFDRVSVTDPKIADVFVVTPNQILINGKAVGVTSLVVFYPKKTMFFDLVVQTDVDLLRERLKQIAPRDEIDVRPTQEAIILQGSVSSEELLPAAAEVASVFSPEGHVINLLTVKDTKTPQVLLQVQVAEVAREALSELGFSYKFLGDTIQGGAFPGTPFFPPIGLLTSGAPVSPDLLFSDLVSFFFSSPDRDFAGFARALAERNMLRVLAKPNLVTESGKEASFLAGGEFPFPVPQASGGENITITIEFKPFGVQLSFLPVVVDGETINLKVEPKVSALDFETGLSFSGFEVPALRENSAFTTVNLKDGESFVIAGLIDNRVRQSVAKIPLLGDIPILGALFRSTRFQKEESELLFIVTAKLVEPAPPGSPTIPDPTKLLELREDEKEDFTLVPGIPGVGEVLDHPFGKSNLEGM
ncbi:MAG: type II and III secretion system protein family protein [Thermoplasmata archaeon]